MRRKNNKKVKVVRNFLPSLNIHFHVQKDRRHEALSLEPIYDVSVSQPNLLAIKNFKLYFFAQEVFSFPF